MHSYMDSKLMAKLLRQALAEREIDVSHSDCLELVARQFGVANWNILSARIDSALNGQLALPQGWIRTGDSHHSYRSGLDPQSGVALIENLPDQNRLGDGAFCTLMQSVSAEPYLGRRIRLIGEIRTDNAPQGGTIWLRIDGENARNLRFDNLEGHGDDKGVVKGTSDWVTREIVFDVPDEAASVHFGFFLKGMGRCQARRFALDIVDDSVAVTSKRTNYPQRPVNMDFRGPTAH